MKLSCKTYATLLFELTSGKTKAEIEKICKRFLLLLKKEKKMKLLKKILSEFTRFFNAENNILPITLSVVSPLKESMKKKLAEQFQSLMKVEHVEIRQKLDPRLLGGFIIQYHDEQIDMSVRKKISLLKQSLS